MAIGSALKLAGTAAGSAVGRGAKGAVAGGIFGFMNTGDWQGTVGGAAGGALFGAAGMPAARKFAANRGWSVSNRLGAGLSKAGQASSWSANKGMDLMAGGAISGNIGTGMFHLGRGGMRGANKLGGMVAEKQVAVNKWGGRGLAALGLGSSAYMGSSMISSNRGY